MKIKIATRVPIKKVWLDEVKLFIPDVVFEVVPTTLQMTVYYKLDQQSMYGDFSSVRSIVDTKDADARVFILSYDDLRTLGITNHLALYDNSDRDGVLDTYIGLDTYQLDRRAMDNGFRSNFAWEVCHELSHGREQNLGREYMATNGDRTHAMEAQGKLKELWYTETVSFLQNILLGLLLKWQSLMKPQYIHPVPPPYRNQITQQYGVENPIYTITKHHIGEDYSCPVGTKLVAPANGEVIKVSTSPERGRYIHFKHGDYVLELRHLYLGAIHRLGMYKQGEVIATSGDSGHLSTGPHVCVVDWIGKDGLSIINEQNWAELTIVPSKLYAE